MSSQSRAAGPQGALKPLLLPIRPLSDKDGQNARQHPMARHRRAKAWRDAVGDAATAAGWPRALPWPRAVVTITIVAKRGAEPDDDGVVGMSKSCRDSIAKWFGCGDAPGGPVTWRYKWERGPDGTRIEIEEASDAG